MDWRDARDHLQLVLEAARQIAERAQQALERMPEAEAERWQVLAHIGARSREVTERIVALAGPKAAALPPPAYLAPHTRVWVERANCRRK